MGMVETGRGVAHTWMADMMGHLNSRHYAAMFDDASFHLLGRIASMAELKAKGLGWADVRVSIEYKHEVAVGACLVITGGIVKLGRTSITYRQEMRDAFDGTLHAAAESTTVLFDMNARKSAPIEGYLRSRAEALQVDAA